MKLVRYIPLLLQEMHCKYRVYLETQVIVGICSLYSLIWKANRKESLDKSFPPIKPSYSINGIKTDGVLGRIHGHMLIYGGPFLSPPLCNAPARSLGHRSPVECCNHGPNIYKDTKHWMSAFLKNWPVKVLGGSCLSLWGPRSPPPPPPVTTCMNTYPCTVLIHTGKGGRGLGEPVRRLEGR